MWSFTPDFIKLGLKRGQTEVIWANLIVSKSDASVEFSMSFFCPLHLSLSIWWKNLLFLSGKIPMKLVAKFHGLEARLFGSVYMDLYWELNYRLKRIVWGWTMPSGVTSFFLMFFLPTMFEKKQVKPFLG